jgi:GNAT superfamily N-acetyltransferase
VLGFSTTGPCRDENGFGWGELYALYVDPDEWGRGTGGALLGAASQRLAASGWRDASLWVLSGNVRARRFYEWHGWVPTDTVASREFAGVQVDEVRYVLTLGMSPLSPA